MMPAAAIASTGWSYPAALHALDWPAMLPSSSTPSTAPSLPTGPLPVTPPPAVGVTVTTPAGTITVGLGL